MTCLNSRTAAYSIRIPLTHYNHLLKASDATGLTYRQLTKIAIKRFIETGEVEDLKIEKAA